MPLLETLAYVIVFFAACFSFAWVLKEKLKAQVFLRIISIVRTKKPLEFFQKFSRFHRLFKAFANLGIIIGFGSLGIDYLYGLKLSKPKRIILFIFSFAALSAIMYFIIGRNAANPLVSSNLLPIIFSFGIFGLAGFSMLLLAINAFDVIAKILTGGKALPGVAPLIPGIQIPNVPIFVPLHGWLSLLIILVVHESFHGILAAVHKIKLKSSGLVLFGFLPIGAFVEPDEKKFQAEKPVKKLQVLSVGSMSNLALFAISLGIFLLLFSVLVAPFASPQVQVISVSKTLTVEGVEIPAPAFEKLKAGDIVLELNGVKVSSIEQFSALAKQSKVLEFMLLGESGEERFETIEKASSGSIGAVFSQPLDESKINPLSILLVEFFFWLFMLNLFVAIANLLPIEPFDGGKMVKILCIPYLGFLRMPEKDKEKLIGRIFIWIVGLLLLINALPLFQF